MTRLLKTGPYAPPEPRRRLTASSPDGARINIEIHGPQDAPVVVLAHGWTCSTAFWAPVIRDLAADHRVIAYDQRGHGRSPAASSPGGYSTTALADDLGAVLDAALEPGEQAVIVGHSMGAMTIIAAANRPYLRERATATVLVSTGASRLRLESKVFPIRIKALRKLAHRVMLVSKAPMGPVTPISKRLLKYVTMGPAATPEQLDACARIVQSCPRKPRGEWGRVLAGLELDAEVRRMPVPTAVIQGTADRLTPAVHARRIEAALPQSEGLTELPGRGHMTPVESTEDVVALIREIVKKYGQPETAEEKAEKSA
ncbi:alpha/beta hydrolase [Streptomyces sp. A7024]|uniref:Alpha/beta hydrolase n=1 Tax=Streptomyces coryli TaxID=1128680 RepID=A0A6G4U970_9ACTN|nr:alpha/beta hydrolase [Streptomyces coryli]NGN68785.1 alpha/beta hydrolase [Streptomyces coryli]